MTKEQIHKRVLELAKEECKKNGVELNSTEGSKIKSKVRNDFLKSREFLDKQKSDEEDKEMRSNYIKAVMFAQELKKKNVDEYSPEGREIKRRIYNKKLSDSYINNFFGLDD
jgi:hypothetical protein